MKGLRWWIIGYFIAVGVTFLAPLASGSPDGLERVAEDRGFIERALDASYQVIPDYVFPGVSNEALATIIAGIVGVTIVYGLVFGLAYLAYKRNAAAQRA
jgi:hypothetical protein